MASSYRADYASVSPRTTCCHCQCVIRSGELRLMLHSTFRHASCVTSLEVLKLWQSCGGRGFDALPGFRELEHQDRAHLQALFRALLLSTPSHARSRMAAAAAQAAENATAAIAAESAAASRPHRVTLPSQMQDALQPSSASPTLGPARAGSVSAPVPAVAAHQHFAASLYRDPSADAAMTESPLSAALLSPSLTDAASLRSTSSSPPAVNTAVSASSSAAAAAAAASAAAASSSSLPPSQPQLGSAHSILAGHLSALSLPGMSAHQPQHGNLMSPTGNGSGGASGGSLGQRSLLRDASASSSHSSPNLHGRHASFGAPSSSAAGGFGSRSVSPFGLLSLQPPQQHNGSGLAPSSPHSSHTSPVPFAHMLYSQQQQHQHQQQAAAAAVGNGHLGFPAAAASLFGAGAPVQPAASSSSAFASSSSSFSSRPHGSSSSLLRSKRKLDSAIPEEEAPSSSAGGSGGGGGGHGHPPPPHHHPQQPQLHGQDAMMDGSGGDMEDEQQHQNQQQAVQGKRRRTEAGGHAQPQPQQMFPQQRLPQALGFGPFVVS